LALALGLYAVEQGHYVILQTVAWMQGLPALPEYAFFFGYVDYILETLVGVGMILALLHEDQRDLLEAPRPLAQPTVPFRHTFEPSGVGLALLTPAGRFLRITLAFVRFLGYAPEELACRRLVDLSPPEDLQNGISSSEQGLRIPGGLYEREKRYRHKDGR